ncbi:MAG: hypothetical protein JW795_02360, partial [Chitinivibrionales bacterium]|nr:hypothetical protein [Chitinivibrionales bacterium]
MNAISSLFLLCVLVAASVRTDLQQADECIQQGRFRQARAIYEQILKEQKNNKTALSGLFLTLIELKEYRRAAMVGADYFRRYPSFSFGVSLVTVCALANDEKAVRRWYEEAIQCPVEFTSVVQKKQELLLAIAQGFLDGRHYEKAYEWFSLSTSLYPGDERLAAGLSAARSAMMRPEQTAPGNQVSADINGGLVSFSRTYPCLST